MYPITKQNIIIRSCSFTRCNVFTRFLFRFAAFSLSGQFPRAYTAPCCLFVTYVVYLLACFVITLPFLLPCLLVSFAISQKRVQKGAKLSSNVPPTMNGIDIFYFLSVPVSPFLYRQAAVLLVMFYFYRGGVSFYRFFFFCLPWHLERHAPNHVKGVFTHLLALRDGSPLTSNYHRAVVSPLP